MKYACVWLLWMTLAIGYSQNCIIKDMATGRPIEGVLLMSRNPLIKITTDKTGSISASLFTEAKEIFIYASGYNSKVVGFEQLSTTQDFFLEALHLDLDQVIVSASRWSQSSQNLPAHITKISPKDIQLRHPQTAADLLNMSGQVFIQKSQQGGGSPMIRGFATNRLLYAVDGVRMNTAIFRSGNIQNVINLDPFIMQSAEVVFGPGSVLYGSDAIGGVMAFQTQSPIFSVDSILVVTGKSTARYSTANKEKTIHLDVNLGGEKWATVTSFSRWDFDHLQQGSRGPEDYIKSQYVKRVNDKDEVIIQKNPLLQIPSGYSQYNLLQKVKVRPKASWSIEMAQHFSTTSEYGRYDRHNRFRNGEPRYAVWEYGPQVWSMTHLSIEQAKSNLLYDQLSVNMAYQRFQESRIERIKNQTNESTQKERVDAYSLNLDAVKSTGIRNTVYYGLEYVFNDVQSKGWLRDIESGSRAAFQARYPQAKWNSAGAYVTDQFQVNPTLAIQSGIRYTNYRLNADFSSNQAFFPLAFTKSEIQQSAITGSFGAVWKFLPNWQTTTSLGTGFRSPNVDDMGKIFDSAPGVVVVPNPSLKAEYAYTIEIGIARRNQKQLQLELNGFYTWLDNALVRRDFLFNGADSILFGAELSRVQAIQNAAQAQVYGIQAGLIYNFFDGLSFDHRFNAQKGWEQLDDGSTSPLRHAAPVFGNSRLKYKTKMYTVEMDLTYQGTKSHKALADEERTKTEIYAKDKEGNPFSPGWYTLTFKSEIQLNSYGRLNFGIENITDQRYRPYTSGLSGAGRNFVLAVTVIF